MYTRKRGGRGEILAHPCVGGGENLGSTFGGGRGELFSVQYGPFGFGIIRYDGTIL